MMTTIISKRTGEWALEAAVEGADRAPFAAHHGQVMKWWGSMNTFDQETLKRMLAFAPKGLHWVSSYPFSVGTALYKLYPEVFDDTTGKSAEKFLASEAGRRFRIPGNKLVKL